MRTALVSSCGSRCFVSFRRLGRRHCTFALVTRVCVVLFTLFTADDYARALALADAQAQASDAYASDDSDNDSLGIDDPDLLDIPPPMTYEAWSVDEMECGAE